jgi:LysR family hydrogen peroxide-inducible transcriptional activator
MVAGGLGVTLLPRIAVAAGVTEGTSLITRPLAAAGAWRTLGLAWRPNAPRGGDYRALAPHLAEVCREQEGGDQDGGNQKAADHMAREPAC